MPAQLGPEVQLQVKVTLILKLWDAHVEQVKTERFPAVKIMERVAPVAAIR